MKLSSVNAVVRYLQTLCEAGSVVELSDGQLLDCFITRGEGIFLEALVLRHGPMVWGVCRRVLRDHHDAEDAFQATFLVLARRAASIMPREKVGNWLYGVAYQTARKARATRAKRRMREGEIPNASELEAGSGVRQNDLAELLDDELSLLPDKYRTPLVLCELEGKTHAEAAEQLDWPIGTVSGRLSRARALLANRLTRKGVLLSGGSLAMLLAQNQGVASANVPASLLSSTVKAASLFAAERTAMEGIVSSGAAALTKEVLKTMLLTRIKITTAITTTALLALTLAGAGLWQARTWADGGKALPEGTFRAQVNEASGKALPEGTFRVTVNEVINDDSTVVTQVRIETLPGSTVELFSNKRKRGSFSTTMAPAGANRPNGPASMQMVIFGDQVEWKGSPAKAVKFMLAYKVGKVSSSLSDTGPMPADAKNLTDILTVPIKSGEYKSGVETKVVTFKGVTYSVVVNKSK